MEGAAQEARASAPYLPRTERYPTIAVLRRLCYMWRRRYAHDYVSYCPAFQWSIAGHEAPGTHKAYSHVLFVTGQARGWPEADTGLTVHEYCMICGQASEWWPCCDCLVPPRLPTFDILAREIAADRVMRKMVQDARNRCEGILLTEEPSFEDLDAQ